MNGWIGPQCPGAFEGGLGVLSEIDRTLALIGAAHWTAHFNTGSEATPRAATYDREADRGLEPQSDNEAGFRRVVLVLLLVSGVSLLILQR
jgi:hypothetical protein